MRRYIYALLITAAAAGAAACDENLSTIAGPDTPDLAPTFTSIQRDILDAGDPSGRRPCVACHTSNGRVPAGGLDLQTGDVHSRIVNGPSIRKPGAFLIVPGDPENSYIVHKVEGRPGIIGLRMPFNGPFLSAGQIQILKRWIEIGAPKN